LALEQQLFSPRVADSFVSPRISSGTKGVSRRFAGKRRADTLSTIFVIARSDGVVAIDRASVATDAPSAAYWTPVVFRFREPGAAEAVMAGARRRLANERRDESDFWYLDMSAGQAAATLKAEAKGLCLSFEVIHPYQGDAPTIGAEKRSWATRVAGVARYALVLLMGGIIGLIVGIALKGF
jgi:hypothetical protein